jgi:hypothetical protein
MSGPGPENEFSRKSSEMRYPSQYDNKDWGAVTKLKRRKVTSKDSKTGATYGSRAIMTKENTLPTFSAYLAEGDDITTLPDSVIGEIKSNINKGAKDLAQKWKNAIELVHTAYHVANVRRPTPNDKGAWKQYEALLKVGVEALSKTRGINGSWRTTNMLVREAANTPMPKPVEGDVGKRRFFVEIPGMAAMEADAKNIDEVIDAFTNKLRRNGATVRVEERTKTHAILGVYVNDVKRDKVIVKEVS